MISEDTREALGMGVVPILLGDGLAARILAMRLLFKYGIQGVICDSHQSLWRFLVPFGSFFETVEVVSSEFLCAELERIIGYSEGGLLMLSPCKGGFAALAKEAKDEIETRFVLAEPRELMDKIFSDE